MEIAMPTGYQVTRMSDVSPLKSLCGDSYRLFPAEKSPEASLHVVEISEAREHYHKRCTEFYYILEGSGEMRLGGDLVKLGPGMLIRIEKGTRHAGRGQFRALVIGVPAWRAEDEYTD